MKTILKNFIGILFLVITINNCKDKEEPIIEPFSGQFDYLKNTHVFKAGECTSLDKVFYLNPDYTPTNGQPIQIFSAGYLISLQTEIESSFTPKFDGGLFNLRINVQSTGLFDDDFWLHKWGTAYFYGWNGIEYATGAGIKDFIYCEITKLDTKNKLISGKFQIIDKKANLTDSFAVMNGVFKNVKIK